MDTTERYCGTRELLRKLAVFRSVAIAAQAAVLYCSHAVLEIRCPLALAIGALLCYALVDAASMRAVFR